MSKKLLLLLPLLTGAPLFLTGALRRPATEAAPIFTPQSIALPAHHAAPGTDAAGLFDQALARLVPTQVSWLRVQLWQRLADPDFPFESEGTLQLGPNHCARLEITVRTNGIPGRWLVISDGNAIAHVIESGKEPPKETSRLLASEPGEHDQPAATPAEALRDLGCGGPYPLLQDLRAKLRDLTAQTGLCQGRPVVRIRGRLNPTATPAGARTAAVDFCYLYLDAQTLWPGRLEWWGRDAKQVPRLLLEMEFRAPQVNRPLSVPECIRAFSYRPKSGA